MSLKQTISINEFDGKHYQITLVEDFEDIAVLTHYLHNYKNGLKKHYEKDAISTLENFVKYKQAEKHPPIVAEDALQQLLFEVENVPFPTPENFTFVKTIKSVISPHLDSNHFQLSTLPCPLNRS